MSESNHILSASQFFEEGAVASIFEKAGDFKRMERRRQDYPPALQHRVVATLFYEASTRTRPSFEAAAQRLGGTVVSTENAGVFSSAVKGETLEDTIRTVEGYVDAIVLRYHEEGGAKRAANVASVPLINAGDGAGEHPTQALLDLFTLREHKAAVDGLKVGVVGDLKYGRTVHSLVGLLRNLHEVEIVAVAPEGLQLPDEYAGGKMDRANDLAAVIGDLDVIYMTRIQKERFACSEEYEALKDTFVLDSALMKFAKPDAVVMHPLPRNNEIATEIDDDPRVIPFQQARNGLFVRMALLDSLIGRSAAGSL